MWEISLPAPGDGERGVGGLIVIQVTEERMREVDVGIDDSWRLHTTNRVLESPPHFTCPRGAAIVNLELFLTLSLSPPLLHFNLIDYTEYH